MNNIRIMDKIKLQKIGIFFHSSFVLSCFFRINVKFKKYSYEGNYGKKLRCR